MLNNIKIAVITILLIPVVLGILFMIPIIMSIASILVTVGIVSVLIGYAVHDYFRSSGKDK